MDRQTRNFVRALMKDHLKEQVTSFSLNICSDVIVFVRGYGVTDILDVKQILLDLVDEINPTKLAKEIIEKNFLDK